MGQKVKTQKIHRSNVPILCVLLDVPYWLLQYILDHPAAMDEFMSNAHNIQQYRYIIHEYFELYTTPSPSAKSKRWMGSTGGRARPKATGLNSPYIRETVASASLGDFFWKASS